MILEKAKKQWNRKDNTLIGYADYYHNDTFTGKKLRLREKRTLNYLDKLELTPQAKILELGYGPGTTAREIVKRGFHLKGIDISAYFCKIASEICSSVPKAKFDLKIGDANHLKYKDHEFDCVIGIGFLQYMKDPLVCLKEAYRVLKPGGYLIIAQHNNRSISSLDNPYHFVKTTISILTNRKHLFRYRDTFLLNLALMGSKFLSLNKIKMKLQRHKKIGIVKKNAIYYRRLENLIKRANLKIIDSSAVCFHSKLWYKFYPTIIHDVLQKWSDKRRKPLKFGNELVFLAKKKEINKK